MAVVCGICQDYLTERSQLLFEHEVATSLALDCGHLFHGACINRWFSMRADSSDESDDSDYSQRMEGNCPSCKQYVSLEDAIRIYPTGDAAGDKIVQLEKDLRNSTAENQRLADQLVNVQVELNLTREAFDAVKSAQDSFRRKHERATSKLACIQVVLQESKEMQLVTENRLEKAESDRKDALKLFAEMEQKHYEALKREHRLMEENEKLKIVAARKKEKQEYPPSQLFSDDFDFDEYPVMPYFSSSQSS